ncbi:MAG: putative small secreted protein [Verrucomicrobiales bacterium]|jgi:predicted small secreted protein
MKLSILKKCLYGVGALILAGYCCSCGNTLYGFGLDMERGGRRLQSNHDPSATSQQGGYTPQQQQP